MAATITEGVLWELQADDSQLVAAYRRAEVASDRAASVAAQSAQKSGAAYDGLKRKVDAAGAATARSMQLTRQQALTLQYTVNDVTASLASGGSPLTILLQQGGQVTQAFGGLRGTVVTLGPAIARAMLSPVGAVTTLAVAVGTIAVAAGNANDKLVAMADTARRTQQQAGAIVGAHIIGARVGLTGEQSDEALANAAKQFEAFRRNSGDVKKIIQDVDKGFLSVADKARTAGDFIGIVSEKIRSLPRDEGLDLAKALFGEDAGERLFDAIRTGAVNMRDLANEAQKAGVSLDDNVIKRAEEMQRKIDAVAEIAGTKLLAAFQTLGDPVANLKLQWFEFVGGIGDAIEKSKELQLVMQGFLHPIDTVSKIIDGKTGAAGEGKFGRLITLDSNEYSKPGNEALLRPQAGETRARYGTRQEAAKATRGGGRSDVERTAEKYAEVTKHLRDQLTLLSAQGAEHEHIALKLKIAAEQAKIGKTATQEQKDNIAGLVTKLVEAEKAQKRLTEQAQAFNEAYAEISGTITDSLRGLISGDKPKDALRFLADRLSGGLLEGGLTGSGPFAKLLGLEGKNGSVGGLFGFAADSLGFGGEKNAQTVNVKGSIVNVAGGQGGLVGEAGGLFSNLFGGKGQGGILSSVVDFFAGLFDTGGTIPAGKFGIAGEKGPEIVTGPATVISRRDTAQMFKAASGVMTTVGPKSRSNARAGAVIAAPANSPVRAPLAEPAIPRVPLATRTLVPRNPIHALSRALGLTPLAIAAAPVKALDAARVSLGAPGTGAFADTRSGAAARAVSAQLQAPRPNSAAVIPLAAARRLSLSTPASVLSLALGLAPFAAAAARAPASAGQVTRANVAVTPSIMFPMRPRPIDISAPAVAFPATRQIAAAATHHYSLASSAFKPSRAPAHAPAQHAATAAYLRAKKEKMRDLSMSDVAPNLSSRTIDGTKRDQAVQGHAMPLPRFSGYFAGGGVIPSGKWGIAGEMGPEIIAGPAQIIPAKVLSERDGRSQTGAQSNVFNFHFPPGTDARSFQQSETQISAMVARAIARGQRNL